MKVNTPSKVLGVENGLHKGKDERSLPNSPLNTFVLGLIRKSRVLSLQSKSKVGGASIYPDPPDLLLSYCTLPLSIASGSVFGSYSQARICSGRPSV